MSRREREIADLVAAGCTNKEIAQRLMLSVKTVAAHLGRAFGRLGVTSRAALAARVRG
ncbi:MAG: response regulator transcription factor [Pseudonocardia sp.]